MRWRGELHAALSCDGDVPEGEAFGSAFAAAVTDSAAEILGVEPVENGACVSVVVDASDEAAAEAQLEELLEQSLAPGFEALAGADRDFGWTAGVQLHRPR